MDIQAHSAEQEICRGTLLEKYAKDDESSVDEVRRRVARALAQAEAEDKRAYWERRFLQAQEEGFIPAGRINSAAGVEPAGDAHQLLRAAGGRLDLRSGRRPARHLHRAARKRPKPCAAAAASATTSRRSGRKGAEVKGTRSRASGPLSYMRVFDRSCETVESAGSRRGAQMGVLRCDHPDIEDFIHAKDNGELLELQHLGRRDRRVHGRGRARRARSSSCTRREPRGSDAEGAYQRERRPLGLSAGRARATCGSRSCARPTITPSPASCSSTASTATTTSPTARPSRRPIPAPSSRCRPTAAAASARSISRAFVARSVQREARASISSASASIVEMAVRMLDNVLDVTAWPLAAAARGSDGQAPRRPGLHRPGRRADHAAACGTTRAEARDMAARISESMRDHAYRASVELAQGARRVSAVQRRPVPRRRRTSPRACPTTLKTADPQARHPQLASALDRADRHDQPRLRRQRVQRHRAAVLLDLHAQEAHGRRHAARSTPSRTTPGACYRHMRRRRGDAAALFRHRARDLAPPRTSRWSPRSRRSSTPASRKTVNVPEDYPYERFPGPLLEGVEVGPEGARDLPSEQGARLGALGAAATDAPQDFVQRRSPTAASRSSRCPRRCWRACAGRAGPSSPAAIRRGPTWSSIRSGASRSSSATSRTGRRTPFEVWVNGSEQPRGLGALAKTLSMDMRADDRAWLRAEARRAREDRGRRRLRHAVSAARAKRSACRRSSRRSRRSCAGAASELSAFCRRRRRRVAGAGRDVRAEGTARPAPTARCPGPSMCSTRDRRRFRAGPEGDHPARRRHAPPVFDVAVGRISARARRPVQDPVARHARARPGVDRHEAAQAARLPRAARRLHGVRARRAQAAELAPRPSPTWRGSSSTATRCSACSTSTAIPTREMGMLEAPRGEARARRRWRARLPRVRQLRRHPQGRLRFLHRLRLRRGLRKLGSRPHRRAFARRAPPLF